MSLRLLPAVLAAGALAAFAACSVDPSAPAEASGDAGASSSKDAARTPEDDDDDDDDAGAGEDSGAPGDGGCSGPIVTTPGETCVGFGAKAETCDPACGQAYGYVCFGGAPPGFDGCRKVQESSFGQTYCCPKNDCVAQPDLDSFCGAVDGKPRRFQCPPDGAGGHAEPPAGCTESGSGGSDVEKFYCCP